MPKRLETGEGGFANPTMYKNITEAQQNRPKVTLPNGLQVDADVVDAMTPKEFDEWYANVSDADPADIEEA
jgi:hypothetical protein